MSININHPTALPNIDELEQLANAFFKALPGDTPTEVSLNPADHPKAKGFAGNLLGGTATDFQPAGFAHDNLLGNGYSSGIPHSGLATPPSATGLGAAAAVPDYTPLVNTDTIVATDTVASNAYSSEQGGRIPSSVAGSGASPSYLQQGDSFNINNPATAFPDANIDKQTAPHTSVGSHIFSLPFENEQPYWGNIDDIVKQINISDAGIPVNSDWSGFQQHTAAPSNYYFVKESFLQQPLGTSLPVAGFNVSLFRKDFPILSEKINGRPLVWFDNAATTQKPASVMERIKYFYEHENSNIHRAAHTLAARATDAYEAAREKVRAFIGAGSVNEIIFVRGATEGINLVANSWGDQYLQPGDEIIVSNLEHHANIVPWKRLADKKGLKLKVIPVDDSGQLLLDEYTKLLTPKTKLVAVTQVSNALGTVTPVQQIVALAHAAGAKVLVDGAQSVSHMAVNVKTLDADWFVFSGHKIFGPTGIGVVYGKEAILNATQPYQGGGNMIQDVTFEEIKYHNAPNRFEAGTGNIADAVGLGAALDYVSKIGIENIGQYEHFLLEYATNQIKQISGVNLIGTASHKASVLSFTLDGYSNDEVGKALNEEGIAVRTGHHCAQPILRRMGVETCVRPSLAFYNTCEEVDRFIQVLKKLSAKK